LIEIEGGTVESYGSAEAFLAAFRPGRKGCLVVDGKLPAMDGLELLERLKTDGHQLPAIMITAHGDPATAVRAMKAGAADFIEKPVSPDELLTSLERVIRQSENLQERSAWRAGQARRVAGLTDRQREIMELVVAGHANKEIAGRLGINQRTVESHRALIMKKTAAKSFADLVRLALAVSQRQ
jgi:two-component system CheB/CheR fusion protein